jgi:hypothetical protein
MSIEDIFGSSRIPSGCVNLHASGFMLIGYCVNSVNLIFSIISLVVLNNSVDYIIKWQLYHDGSLVSSWDFESLSSYCDAATHPCLVG